MKDTFVKSLKTKFAKLSGYLIWFLIVLLAISVLRNLGKTGRVRGDIEAEKQKLAKIEAQNKVLQDQLAEAQSADFLEKEIRNKLGLVKDGETVVILPDEDTLRKLAPKIEEAGESLPDPTWKKWLKLFF